MPKPQTAKRLSIANNRYLKMPKFRIVTVLLFVVLGLSTFVLSSPVNAIAANNTINFQARLENSTGSIASDGYYNVEFKLYNASTAGTLEWTEDWTYSAGNATVCTTTAGFYASGDCRLPVHNGYLSVSLGALTTFPSTINWNQQQYLTMNVGTSTNTSIGLTGEMAPRLLLTATPYSFASGSVTSTPNTTTGYQSILSLTQPANGVTSNETFNIADQGTGGAYTVCIQGTAAATGGCAPTTGGTGYIQNQNASAQTTANFWISGTGQAATLQGNTSVLTPTLDSISGALAIGNTNATSVTIGNSSSATNVTINTTAHGGTLINNGATLNTAVSLGNFATGGAIGTAAATVDNYTSFDIAQTTASQTLTIPNPTNTTAGRIIYISNTGTASFLIGTLNVPASSQVALYWNGTAWIPSLGSSSAGGGVTTVNTYSTTNTAAGGATISGSTITFQDASINAPGMVGTGSQTFLGAKTFSGNLIGNGSTTLADTTSSATAFQVQNTSSYGVITADTSSNQLLLGTASHLLGQVAFANSTNTNLVTLNVAAGTAAYGLTLPSTAPATSQCLETGSTTAGLLQWATCSGGSSSRVEHIILSPEYANAVLDYASDPSCTTANSGTMTSGLYNSGSTFLNFYKWAGSTTTTQCYDVVVRVPIPAGFTSWAAAPTITGFSSDGTAALNVDIRDTNGTLDGTAYQTTALGTATWTTVSLGSLTGTYTPGSSMTIRIRMSAINTDYVELGTINLSYNNTY